MSRDLKRTKQALDKEKAKKVFNPPPPSSITPSKIGLRKIKQNCEQTKTHIRRQQNHQRKEISENIK